LLDCRMAYDSNNVFAKILRGELPCIKLAEDSHTLAIMDVMPQAEGHALVVCKEAAETLLDVSPEGAAACIRMTQRIAKAAKQALEVPGLRVMQFTGSAAGQTVPHLHFHIIPVRAGQSLGMHARDLAPATELEAVAMRIRAALV
jgi:histidine triad (HIT) family protein